MFERYYSFFHQCRLSCRYVMFQKQHFEKTEMWGTQASVWESKAPPHFVCSGDGTVLVQCS